MLKKILIVVVVALTMLATVAIADTPEQETEDVKKAVDTMLKLKSAGWPVEFKYENLKEFVIPVYMRVNLYMEILNMKDVISAGLILDRQLAMNKYAGCSQFIEIKSNFPLELEAKHTFTDAGDDMDAEKDKLEIRDDDLDNLEDRCSGKKKSVVPATLCEGIAKRTVYFQIKNVHLVHHEWGKKVHVADIQVRVRPAIDKAQWYIDPTDP